MSSKLLGLIAASGIAAVFATSANAAMSAADCQARYATIDTENHGYITETESPAYFAFYRVGNKTIADGKLMKDMFLIDCAAGYYEIAAVEDGAPLEGANSYTEAQAKDRILAHGGAAVSALKKDDKGIWRGTSSMDGGQRNVAVDYKGNVVFTK